MTKCPNTCTAAPGGEKERETVSPIREEKKIRALLSASAFYWRD
jgi:hypothetical protein